MNRQMKQGALILVADDHHVLDSLAGLLAHGFGLVRRAIAMTSQCEAERAGAARSAACVSRYFFITPCSS